ncbi:MAG TPA: glycosyltransferase [Chthoniobacteraceae bacterium]|jgi:GT2 family glycosyltransferase|nr:glycosyltransferase [Chthoniobacteraceae bacterium]
MNEPTCAISIATLNRLGELRRTLAVVAALDPQPDELLICADGCTDGTAAYVREHFPGAKLIEHARPNGSIRSRIELMHAAGSDIVVSLDDDSYPSESGFIARVGELFASKPHVAVASFPQRTDEFPETLLAEDFGPPRYTANYVNAAAAFRRGVYLQLEGWPADFEHAYDESDYTLQCLAAGYAVYFEPSIVIRHHFTSVERNEIRTHHRHARNEQWCAWRRCPFPAVLAVSLYRAITQWGYAWKRGTAWVVREPRWWWMALRGLPAALRGRRPVPERVYRQWLRLIRHPIESPEKWQAAFGRRQ